MLYFVIYGSKKLSEASNRWIDQQDMVDRIWNCITFSNRMYNRFGDDL